MTAFSGTVIILTLLACIPLLFLFAGKDTDHFNAIRRECQKDALLDWTDKDILAAEHDSTIRPKRTFSPAPASTKIETVSRSAFFESADSAA